MKTLAVALLVGVVMAGPAEETKLGAGVKLKQATPIATVAAKPKDFVGKTIRVDGIASEVCAEMGCWMAIVPQIDDPAAPTVRVKVEDGAIVFPMSAKGKRVSAEGVFEVVKARDADGKEAAGEHARHDPNASTQYQLRATGAVIR